MVTQQRKVLLRPKPTKPAPVKLVKSRVTASKPVATESDRASQGFQQSRDERARGTMLMDRLRARPFDFYMPTGGKARVVVVESQPYFFHEHRWQGSDGKWNRSEVCLKDEGIPCPGCAKQGREGTWVMCLTIIDDRPYTIKSGLNAGKTVKRSRKLMKAKGVMIEKFERWYNSHGKDFKGAVFDLYRSTGPKVPNSGDDFEYVRRMSDADFAKLGKELTQPTDYIKAFKPLDRATFEHVLGAKNGKAVGQEDLEEEPLDADEIPFITCAMNAEPYLKKMRRRIV